MLGEQFKNTYFTNSKGNTTAFVDLGDGIATARTVDDKFDRHYTHGNLQGLLFHPDTGTGVGVDPTIDQAARREAAREGLGLNDPEEYAKNHKNVSAARFSPERAELHREQIENLAVWSHMTTEDLRNMGTHVVVDQQPGRAWASAEGNIVRMTQQQRRPDVDNTGETLMHELGHIKDKGTNRNMDRNYTEQRVDARAEGIADGHMDRFGKSVFADAPRNVAFHTGYGMNYSAFKTKVDKALYVATREHVRSGGDPAKIPGYHEAYWSAGNRANLTAPYRDKAKQAKSVVLGHLAHESPAAAAALDELGFGKEAEKGKALYREAYPAVPHRVELSTGAAGKVSKDQFRMRRYAASLDRKDDGVRREIPGQMALDV